MTQVISLADAAAARQDRDRRREMLASAHPALRWVAGAAFWVAHRKSDGTAACGATGDLMLAPPGVPLCVTCYPPAEREDTA